MTSKRYSCNFIGSLKSSKILLAIFSTFFTWFTFSITIINSSPPILEMVSLGLKFFCKRDATRLIILSPIECPYESLIILKLSISMKNKAKTSCELFV